MDVLIGKGLSGVKVNCAALDGFTAQVPAIIALLFQPIMTGRVVSLTVAGSSGWLKVSVTVVLVATPVVPYAGVALVSDNPPVKLAPQVSIPAWSRKASRELSVEPHPSDSTFVPVVR